MKKAKGILLTILSVIMIASFPGMRGYASGPLDGQIIDGSLLTSEEEAFDERPLVPENPFEEEIMPFGTYLSNGTSRIVNNGNGVVYISGETYCYRTCDSVKVNLYLDRLSNGNWSTVQTCHHTEYNTYVAENGISYSVTKGYYYRVRGVHVAKKGDVSESTSTCTNGIYIN